MSVSVLRHSLLCVALSFGFVVGSTLGQATPSFDEYEVVGTSYHKFVLPGEASIKVLVLGSTTSGIYEVGRDTDFGQLVALSGMPLTPSDGERVSKITLRLFRSEGAQRRKIYEATLEDFLSLPGDYPQLLSGDVVVMETKLKTRFTWRDTLGIITSVAALALAIERVSRTF